MTAATRVRRNAINGWLLGLCCLVCLVVVVQGSSPPAAATATAISKDAAAIHKGLYTKTKRQDKQRGITDVMMHAGGSKQQQQQQQQQPSLTRNAHGLNKKMLSKMGFMKVKAPNSHNRKRLAVESRRHASSDDSHMFIIKLPPNLHYYTGPHNPVKNSLDHHQQQKQQQQQQLSTGETSPTATTEASALKTNGKKVSFPFSSNGRPGRIYHWNLPVLKQALHKQKQKQLNAQTNLGHDHHPQLQLQPHSHHLVSTADRNRLLDIEKQQPTWRKPWENETIEKSFNGKSKYKKSLKPKSPTYYAPAQAVSKQSFHKYFAGNGKPKGFYVIKEHQTKPQFYQNIIS